MGEIAELESNIAKLKKQCEEYVVKEANFKDESEYLHSAQKEEILELKILLEEKGEELVEKESEIKKVEAALENAKKEVEGWKKSVDDFKKREVILKETMDKNREEFVRKETQLKLSLKEEFAGK